MARATDWLELDDREICFGAAGVVVEVFAGRQTIAALSDPELLLDYLGRAIEAVVGASRSAERSDARRRLLLALPRTLAGAVIAFGERGAAWLEEICRDSRHPDSRAALSATILALGDKASGQGAALAQRLRGALEGSAKPPRDPTRRRPGAGRGNLRGQCADHRTPAGRFANLRRFISEAGTIRAGCERCRRPTSVCYCAHLVTLETRTRVVLLQHPREERVPMGTARLAHLCLPSSELHVGIDFDNDQQVRAALADDPSRPAYLLFPGPHAHRSRGGATRRADHAGGRSRDLVAGPQAAQAQRRAGDAATAPVHAGRAQPLSNKTRAGRPLRGNRRGAFVDAGRTRGGSRAIRHAAAPLRGDDRHSNPLRDDGARGAPPPCASPDPQGAAPHDIDDAAGARREPHLRPRRSERLAGATTGRTSRRDRPWVRAVRRPERPSRRSSSHAARWRRRSRAIFKSARSGWRPARAWSSFRVRWEAFAREDDFACSWGRYPLDLLEAEGVRSRRRVSTCGRWPAGIWGARTGSVEDCTTRLGVAGGLNRSPGDGEAHGFGGAHRHRRQDDEPVSTPGSMNRGWRPSGSAANRGSGRRA